jgi:flagellar biosynthesis protein FlhG
VVANDGVEGLNPQMVRPDSTVSNRSLELGRVQFIQQQFTEVLGSDASSLAGAGTDRIYWIHDRLFQDGWSVETVRAILLGLQRNVRVIAVTSGKGGVGKTTVAVNLATALGLIGRRTLLFDGDLGMANVHVFAGVNPRASILDVIDRRITLAQAITQGAHGADFICGASGVSRLAKLDQRVLDDLGRALVQVAANYDVLVIDTGAGIGAATLHLLGLAHEIVIVTTPNLAATLDAYGMIKCIHERNFRSQLHLIVNLADDAKSADAAFTRIAGCARQFLQRPVNHLCVLQNDTRVEDANQSRTPLVLRDPANPGAIQISRVAAQLAPIAEQVRAPSAA